MQATESTTDSSIAENTALTRNVPGVVFSPLGIRTERVLQRQQDLDGQEAS